MVVRFTGPTKLLWTFGAFSLGAVAVGAFVCARSGIPAGLWVRNLGAWAVGAVAAGVVARAHRRTAFWTILWLAPVSLAASFAGRGIEGVHRWIGLGPIILNVALLVLPMTVVALARVAPTHGLVWLPAFACLGLLALQPDASQAVALGAAMAATAWLQPSSARLKGGVSLAALGLIVATCLRPDPLTPVPEVEGIIQLAAGISTVLASLALSLLAGAGIAPLLGTRTEVRAAAIALTVLLAIEMIAPFIGAFPVPLVGVGVSPILGAWLGIGALAIGETPAVSGR